MNLIIYAVTCSPAQSKINVAAAWHVNIDDTDARDTTLHEFHPLHTRDIDEKSILSTNLKHSICPFSDEFSISNPLSTGLDIPILKNRQEAEREEGRNRLVTTTRYFPTPDSSRLFPRIYRTKLSVKVGERGSLLRSRGSLVAPLET